MCLLFFQLRAGLSEELFRVHDEADMAGLDDATLTEYCVSAINAMPAAVEDYKNGKEKALMAVLGNVMKQSRGRADAPTVIKKLKELIG